MSTLVLFIVFFMPFWWEDTFHPSAKLVLKDGSYANSALATRSKLSHRRPYALITGNEAYLRARVERRWHFDQSLIANPVGGRTNCTERGLPLKLILAHHQISPSFNLLLLCSLARSQFTVYFICMYGIHNAQRDSLLFTNKPTRINLTTDPLVEVRCRAELLQILG